MAEFLALVQALSNWDGTATQDSVLHDPEVVKWMAEQKPVHGQKPRFFGYTREVGLLSTLIDATVGRPIMKRPENPGEALRQKNMQNKIKNTLKRIGVG